MWEKMLHILESFSALGENCLALKVLEGKCSSIHGCKNYQPYGLTDSMTKQYACQRLYLGW